MGMRVIRHDGQRPLQQLRGFALRMRLHDGATHLKAAPREAVARAVFDAVETARVEALGSRGYAGIADNLEHSLGVRLRSDPIARARSLGATSAWTYHDVEVMRSPGGFVFCHTLVDGDPVLVRDGSTILDQVCLDIP